jgi:hypothetical protein
MEHGVQYSPVGRNALRPPDVDALTKMIPRVSRAGSHLRIFRDLGLALDTRLGLGGGC